MLIFPKFGNIVIRLGATKETIVIVHGGNVDVSQVRKYCCQAWRRNETYRNCPWWKMLIFPKFGNIVIRLGATKETIVIVHGGNVDISLVWKYCCQAWCQLQDKVVFKQNVTIIGIDFHVG